MDSDDDDGSCTVLSDLTADFGFTIVMTRMKAGYLANTFLPHIEEKGWKAVIGFNSQWTPDDDADGCGGKFCHHKIDFRCAPMICLFNI